jgi:flavin reductase (DIM6/NTAB) family NADH-FMN oxidoreductase RutF
MKKKLGPETLLYPMPAVVVGANVGDKPNFMVASWCGIAAWKPPALTVGLQPNRHTLKGIKEHEIFSINVPSVALVKRWITVGFTLGKKRITPRYLKRFMAFSKPHRLVKNAP